MHINKQLNMTGHVKMVMESVLSLIEETASATGVFCGESFNEITRLELFQFVAYLCASDDVIKQEEIDFLNQVFGGDWNPDTLAAYLRNNAIRNEGFEKMIPFTLEVLIKVDAVLSSKKKGWSGNMSWLFISLYELLSEVFIGAVSRTGECEWFDSLAYVSFLRIFIYENSSCFSNTSEKDKEDVIVELIAQSDDFTISAKKEDLGIIAPRKL